MSLFIVKNGFQGNGWVGVLVEAADEDDARSQAAVELQAYDERQPPGIKHGPEYWNDLSVHPIHVPFVSEFG